MKLGIVGRPKTGKTTLFNLLTRSHQSVDKFGAVRETHLGTAHVPDPRLDRLSALFKPKKHTPATVDFVDVPGIAKGEQEKIDFSALKNVDALVHVLRAFEDAELPHEGGVDPARDAKMLDEELVLCDYVLLEKRREKLEKERKKTKSAELDAEWAAIEKCLPALEAATPLRAAGLSAAEEKCLRGFTLLSLKPLLLVVNVSDADAAAEPVERFGLDGFASQPRVAVVRAAAKIEMELNDLPDEDVPAFWPTSASPSAASTGSSVPPTGSSASSRSSRQARTSAGPGRFPSARPPWSAPGRSTPISPAASSVQRSCPSRTYSISARSPTAGRREG